MQETMQIQNIKIGSFVTAFLKKKNNVVQSQGPRFPGNRSIVVNVKEIRVFLILLLRIRSAHLEILGFPIGDAYQQRDIFARFKIMQRK